MPNITWVPSGSCSPVKTDSPAETAISATAKIAVSPTAWRS